MQLYSQFFTLHCISNLLVYHAPHWIQNNTLLEVGLIRHRLRNYESYPIWTTLGCATFSSAQFHGRLLPARPHQGIFYGYNGSSFCNYHLSVRDWIALCCLSSLSAPEVIENRREKRPRHFTTWYLTTTVLWYATSQLDTYQLQYCDTKIRPGLIYPLLDHDLAKIFDKILWHIYVVYHYTCC